MNIKLLKNTKIDYKNKIAGGIEQLELYLKSYDSGYDDTRTELNTKNISQYSLSITLDRKVANFNEEHILEYDAVIIEDYPYLRNIKSFWLIQNKKFNSESNWTFDLEIDLISTFGIDKIDLDKPFKISRKHIRDLDNFENYETKKLKTNHFYKNSQPSLDFDTFSNLKKEFIYNDNEKEIEANIGSKYWAIFAVNLSEFSSSSDTVYYDFNFSFDDNEDIIIGSSLGFPATPWLNRTFKYPDNSVVPKSSPNRLWARELIDDDSRVESISIIDFQPYNIYSIPDKAAGTTEDPYVIINNSGEAGLAAILTTLDDEVVGVAPRYIKQSNTTSTYKASENLFDFTIADTYFDGTDNDLWTEKHILAMDFPPFKYFELNFSSETPFSRNLFDYSDMDKMIKKDVEFLERRYDFSTPTLSYNDKLLNKSTGQSNFGLRRDFTPSRATDAWKEYNHNKTNRSMTDFGLPVAAAGAGAVAGSVVPGIGTAIGAGVGAAIGIGTSVANTVLKRQKVKGQPDTTTEASIDFGNVLLKGLDTKGIYIHTPISSQKTAIAFELHKWGLYFHDMGKKFNNKDEILPKKRFNYLEISSSENINIIKDLDRVYSMIYLGQFKGGITLWEYGNSDTDNYIFNYNYKNPDKKGILEQMNEWILDIEAGYNYYISVDREKYDNGLTITAGLTTSTWLNADNTLSIPMAPNITGTFFNSNDLELADRLQLNIGSDDKITFIISNVKEAGFFRLYSNWNPDDIEVTKTATSLRTLRKESKENKKKLKKLKNENSIVITSKKELTEEQRKAMEERTKIKGGR